jgi:MarR family transcriptional regulator, organic hydroperoxide resistance regulator
MPTVSSAARKSAPARASRGMKKKPARSSAAATRVALELQTLQCLRTVFGTARSHDAEVRSLAGIPGSQLWALSEIARTGGMSVNELSERMALHQTTASNLVNALVERKLIRRARDELDQRVVRLHVNTSGKRILLRAPGPYAGLLVDALRQLDRADLAKLHRSLEVLVNELRRTAPGAAGEPLLGGD